MNRRLALALSLSALLAGSLAAEDAPSPAAGANPAAKGIGAIYGNIKDTAIDGAVAALADVIRGSG